jgi:hypothetical protein
MSPTPNYAMLPRTDIADKLDMTPLHIIEHHNITLAPQARSNSHILALMGRTTLGAVNV